MAPRRGEPRADDWSLIAEPEMIGGSHSENATWESLLLLERRMVIEVEGSPRVLGLYPAERERREEADTRPRNICLP
jgi:hypothetical protein